VATIRPPTPWVATIPATITINAPVGPPICTRLPPNSEMQNPPTTAVIRPCDGETPEAMPKAIESGMAIMATTSPAKRSRENCSVV